MVRKIKKNKKSYTTYDVYNNWAKETESEVSYVRFKRISEAFNKLISDSILDASDGFKMPYGLGYVRIIKYRHKTYTDKSLSVDYTSSKE